MFDRLMQLILLPHWYKHLSAMAQKRNRPLETVVMENLGDHLGCYIGVEDLAAFDDEHLWAVVNFTWKWASTPHRQATFPLEQLTIPEVVELHRLVDWIDHQRRLRLAALAHLHKRGWNIDDF